MKETDKPKSTVMSTSSSESVTGFAAESQFPVCTICGSERIVRDAWAAWQSASREWMLEEIFDHTFCLACETDAGIEWRTAPVLKTERIRRLNDALRVHGIGNGQTVVTAGVQAKGRAFQSEASNAVAAFNAFNAENDPHGEHDFGAVIVRDEKLFFKIDYYDLSLSTHSPDASDPQVTRRTLTIMLAGEY